MLFQKISVQQGSEEQKSLIHWGLYNIDWCLHELIYADLSLEVFAIA